MYKRQDIKVPGDDVDKSFTTFFQETRKSIRNDPGQHFKWYVFEKPNTLWQWELLVGFGDIYLYRVNYSLYHLSKLAMASYSVMKVLHPKLLILALLGVGFSIFSRDAQPALIMMSAILVYTSGVYIVTQAAPRYSIPLRPEMYILAVYAIWSAIDKLVRIRQNQNHTGHES